MSEFAGELLKGERSGKYSPVEVAQWLEDLADGAERDLAACGIAAAPRNFADWRSMSTMQAGLGRFFAAKFRSGVLYSRFTNAPATGARSRSRSRLTALPAPPGRRSPTAPRESMRPILSASDKALRARPVGWTGLPAIDDDIARWSSVWRPPKVSSDPQVAAAIAEALGAAAPQARLPAPIARQLAFRPSAAVALEIGPVEKGRKLASARLYYRHVNQAERYQSVEMEGRDNATVRAFRRPTPTRRTRCSITSSARKGRRRRGCIPGSLRAWRTSRTLCCKGCNHAPQAASGNSAELG